MSDAIYVLQMICEILYGDPNLRVIPIFGNIDSKQLSDQNLSSKQCDDMRLRLDIAGIQKSVQTKEIESIQWIPTAEMLADCLTKKGADTSVLSNIIENGLFIQS